MAVVVLVAGKVHGRNLGVGYGHQLARHTAMDRFVQADQFVIGALGQLEVAMGRFCV